MPGKNSVVVPPESIPNSEVKHFIANGSTGSPRVRVGKFQAKKTRKFFSGFFVFKKKIFKTSNNKNILYSIKKLIFYRSKYRNFFKYISL